MTRLQLEALCQKARKGSYTLLSLDTEAKNNALAAIADYLIKHKDDISRANALDLAEASANGISEVMLDRLTLTPQRIEAMASSVLELIQLKDPVGSILEESLRPNGLKIVKKAVPFGVVAMIYESRPNVTVDAACIALKTSNAIVLKGGKEAIFSNRQLVAIIKMALESVGIDPDILAFVDATDRETTLSLLSMKAFIDILIPRGGASLIQWVCTHSSIPVLETGAGNCHLYVDSSANMEQAITLLKNAKLQRPSVCNAIEKAVVHSAIAHSFIPLLLKAFDGLAEMRLHESAAHYAPQLKRMDPAEYGAEYLDYILGVIVVDSAEAAIQWINTYSTHHSEVIVTENLTVAQSFMTQIDSAVVYHNASSRFTDGGEFGFGAEIGIATSKLHARGPMGLEAMTTYKYLVYGNGQIR